MSDTADSQFARNHLTAASTTVTPGLRESAALTRFAPSVVAHAAVDMTLDAATIADRQREGGGSPAERRPKRAPWWKSLMARSRTDVEPQLTLPESAPGTPTAKVVEFNPRPL